MKLTEDQAAVIIRRNQGQIAKARVKRGRPIVLGPKPVAHTDLPRLPALPKHFARARLYDGKRFGSGQELKRWKELEVLQKLGVIANLVHQPRWDLVVNGTHVGRYTADASWTENGSLTVEDTKSRSGWKSRDYPLRKKLMKAIYGIEIREHVDSSATKSRQRASR